jgi:methylthioribulose-1-phosphate dehydratase
MNTSFNEMAQRLAEVGRRFDARGWVLGTSGNFSAVLGRAPLRIAITRSSTHKGDLTSADILEIADEGIVVRGAGIPSAETRLHLEIVSARHAGAVLHTHSIWSTFLSDRCSDRGGVAIEGYEMLKGLSGVLTHEHREWIPVIENDQNMARLAVVVRELLGGWPDCHAFLLRRHGLYTWGETLQDAIRHVEIVEFLLESVGRAEYSGQAKSEEAAPWRS